MHTICMALIPIFILIPIFLLEADACSPKVWGYPLYIVEDDNGRPLDNPNDTLYPGDQMVYKFRYSWDGCNCGKRTHPTIFSGASEAKGSMNAETRSNYEPLKGKFAGRYNGPMGVMETDIAKTNNCHGGGSRGESGYGGEDGWSRDRVKSCGHIKFSITAGVVKCNAETCWCAKRHASDTIRPKTVAPVTETLFTEHVLLDPYRYNATNPDMTNYPWDPIAIEHVADFGWKNEREGTIRFQYDRSMEPLVEEGGYECEKRCSTNLRVGFMERVATEPGRDISKCVSGRGCEPLNAVGIGFVSYPWKSENGGGMYAYTAPTLGDAGEHTITYGVTVLNRDRMINTHTNEEQQLVVLYEPVFDHYEYPVLRDSNRYAYDNRQAMTIWYGGSIGGGPDDNGELNAERRSRINAFYPDTLVHSEGEYYQILPDGKVLVENPPIRIDHKLLEWDSIGHINGTDTYTDLKAGVDVGMRDQRWHTTDVGHAMFSGEGFGILRLSQAISDIILDDKNWDRWYYSTTTYNEIASDRWAGHDSFRNWNYTYRYPHTPFAQWFNMTSYDSGMNVTGNRLHVNMTYTTTHSADDIPERAADSNVSVTVPDYMYAKTLHDIVEDELFSTGVPEENIPLHREMFAIGVRDEMAATHHEAEGTGTLSMWLNKTVIEFPQGYTPEAGILGMSRYDALDADAIMYAEMDAGGHSNTESYTFEFWNDIHRKLAQGTGWKLDTDRLTSSGDDTQVVRLELPDIFDDVTEIFVDGTKVTGDNANCIPDCTVTMPGSGHITIHNKWGAEAGAGIGEEDQIEPPNPEETLDDSSWFIFTVGVICGVIFMMALALKRLYRTSLGQDEGELWRSG